MNLVKPFGFEISDSRLKRASFYYWQYISLFIYESSDDFYAKNKGGNFVYFSSSGTQDYCAIDYKDEMFFIFGKEAGDLPKNIVTENPDSVYNTSIYSSIFEV